jgi:hypothetical protein
MYGNSFNILSVISNNQTVICNLTSYREDIPKLDLLLPPREIGHFVDRDFDIAYMNYILGNDRVFYQFFGSIIMNLYLGFDVYIAISEEDWSINLVESLLKLIQQRYGYNGLRINDMNDYTAAVESGNFKSRFDVDYGLANLDLDKNRYSMLEVDYNPERFQTPDRDFVSNFNY